MLQTLDNSIVKGKTMTLVQSSALDTANDTKPLRRYRVKLDTLNHVKREMAKTYRECRSGLIDVQDASRCVFMLASIGKVIEGSDLEKRIEALETGENE